MYRKRYLRISELRKFRKKLPNPVWILRGINRHWIKCMKSLQNSLKPLKLGIKVELKMNLEMFCFR